MPNFEATMLPPAAFDDLGSSRSLDELGAVTVLGAMVEQRRRSAPDLPRHCELDPEHLCSDDEDDSDAIATQKREAIDPSCDAFMKIR